MNSVTVSAPVASPPAPAVPSAPVISGTIPGAAAQFVLTAGLFGLFLHLAPALVPGPAILTLMALTVFVLDVALVRAQMSEGAVRAPLMLEVWIRTAAAAGITFFMLALSLLLG